MNRYQFDFRNVADKLMEELGLGRRETTFSVSILAHNEDEAVVLASAMIKCISSEQWYELFVSAMESGDYTLDGETHNN